MVERRLSYPIPDAKHKQQPSCLMVTWVKTSNKQETLAHKAVQRLITE
jgi:hypothetical protein